MAWSIVGKVISPDTGRFQWTIDDFLSKAWEKCRLHSPTFRFSDAGCYLYFTYTSDGPLKLCFCTNLGSRIKKLNVKLRMRTGYRGKIETRRGEMHRDKYTEFQVNAWMLWSEFLQRRSEILNDGRLTVFCELENASVLQKKLPSKIKVTVENEASGGDSDEEETSTEEESTDEGETSVNESDEDEMISKSIIIKKMQEDFKNLLTSGEDSDVTIKVQGKEFPAIRGILRARSPVFKSMFSHDTVEKQSGVVVIDDCDPDTFPDFLNYLYTGSTKHICNENVFSLYTVSDKYGVKELKEWCAAFMESNMSVGTFCDTITLALRHTDKELVDSATVFFCENGSEIIKTVKWQTFLRENSTVGNELFIKLLSTNN